MWDRDAEGKDADGGHWNIPDQGMGYSVSGKVDVAGLKEARTEEIAEGVVFLVESEDGS